MSITCRVSKCSDWRAAGYAPKRRGSESAPCLECSVGTSCAPASWISRAVGRRTLASTSRFVERDPCASRSNASTRADQALHTTARLREADTEPCHAHCWVAPRGAGRRVQALARRPTSDPGRHDTRVKSRCTRSRRTGRFHPSLAAAESSSLATETTSARGLAGVVHLRPHHDAPTIRRQGYRCSGQPAEHLRGPSGNALGVGL